MNPQSLFIIDGSSLVYRSYYGVKPLHTSTGIATHAFYGFFKTLKKITDDFSPSHLIIVWDSKGPTTRQQEYAEYKATRQSAPDDLIMQKKAIIDCAERMGIAQLMRTGHEADDLIYSLIYECQNTPITVVTGDKDLHQLLTTQVSIFDPFKQKTITHQSFCTERRFTPTDLLLYHSLLGDSSDNIPGVTGIGAKTAQILTERYHTMAALYENIETVTPPRLRDILTAHKADALLSEKLFTLRYEPTATAYDTTAYNKQRWTDAIPFFHQYEIKPILPSGVTFQEQAQTSLFAAPQSTCKTHLITTQQQLDALIALLAAAPLIAFDTETRSLQPFKDGIIGIACSLNDTEGYYIPFGHSGDEIQLSEDVVLAAFKPLLENHHVPKVFHHAKFDMAGFAYYGITVQGIVGDTLLMASPLRTGSESIGLKALSVRYLKEAMTSFDDLVKGKKTFADIPLAIAAPYAADDARQTRRLYDILSAELAKEPLLLTLYTQIELPLCMVLFEMECYGIRIQTPYLEALAQQAQEELAHITAKITACLSGGQQSIIAATINLNSPQQLENLLFDQLKLPSFKKNVKTGSRSTDSEVLSELAKIHPIPGLIIQYRELSKLLNTYLLPLPLELNSRTHKIHTTYTQTITATGRLSSTDPNLQNIPISHPLGSKVRNAFIAPEGYIFISADYSQIELRILAQFSQDSALLTAFARGADIHRQTAALIFHKEEQDVTPAERSVGKKINFSIMYGLTPFGLSKDLGISPAQAKAYIEAYFDQYAGVKAWMDAVIADAKQTGYVSTLLGRRRFVPGLHERNKNIQEAERRVAINTPIQGTSADIIKMAMIKLTQELKTRNLPAHLVLQIHDELIIATPEAYADEVRALTIACMSAVVNGWNVSLEVTTRVGRSWGEVSK
jgi:DNA polymerase-1